MKIKNITDINRFFQVLDRCKGKVELVTSEGDRLNMRSKLCQYVALSKIFSEAKIDEIELFVSEPEDATLLMDYLIRG
ncbi:MAG: polya polymerase [Pelosinus sp.]|nr:polya polymerase [Pelosinus sp.]